MSRKFYTIFILPHAHARFRKMHVSRNFVIAVAVLGVTIGGVAAWAPSLFFRARALADHAASVEAENRKLRDDKVRYETALAQIGDQLTAIEGMAGKLAQRVGLKDLPSERPAGGVGAVGATRPEMFGEERDALQKRMENLDASFDRLEQAWDERLQVLASTPSLQPVGGFFSDGYGWRRDPIDGSREFHKGVDIVAPPGTPVKATADGVVRIAQRWGDYGNLVVLEHPKGFTTRYGHLSVFQVSQGARVHKNDIIGYVGMTGRATAPHLHYEVRLNDRPVNPRPYLR